MRQTRAISKFSIIIQIQFITEMGRKVLFSILSAYILAGGGGGFIPELRRLSSTHLHLFAIRYGKLHESRCAPPYIVGDRAVMNFDFVLRTESGE